MSDAKQSDGPKWIKIGAALLGLIAAGMFLIVRYYEIKKTKAEADQAQIAAEKARSEKERPTDVVKQLPDPKPSDKTQKSKDDKQDVGTAPKDNPSREKDAAALLKKTLEGFPLNCMTASVVGEPKVVEKNGDKATVSVTVQVEPNMEAYKAFVKKLQPVLEQMVVGKEGKGDFSVISAAEKFDNDVYLRAYAGKPNYSDYSLDRLFKTWMPRFIPDERRPVASKIVVAICTQRNTEADRLEYNYFVLDKSLQPLLVQNGFDRSQAKLELEGQNGDTVVSDRFELFEKVSFNNWGFEGHLTAAAGWRDGNHLMLLDGERDRKDQEKEAVIFFISPTFVAPRNDFCHKPKLQIERKLALTLDELKKVQKARVQLQAK